MDGVAGILQHFGDEGVVVVVFPSLPVTAMILQDRPEKKPPFQRLAHLPFPWRTETVEYRKEFRRAENDIPGRDHPDRHPQMKHCTHGLQLVSQGNRMLCGGFVTGGNGNPRLKQGLDKGVLKPQCRYSDGFP